VPSLAIEIARRLFQSCHVVALPWSAIVLSHRERLLGFQE